MRYRKLRIAWSVAFGIATMVLIVLWVRSHQYCDLLREPISANRAVLVASLKGQIVLVTTTRELESPDAIRGFVSESNKLHLSAAKNAMWGFDCTNAQVWQSLCAPHWFGVGLSTILAVAPWIRWRFTTRTLLLAVTAVGMVLGAGVYASH